MLFRNYTPFPPLQFESRDEKRNDFGVIVLRGTFQIESGKRLRLVQKQEPLVMADEYYGQPGMSSIRLESSIAPYKPKTDILVNATAYSPSGQPEKQWLAGIQFGNIQKVIQVTGPRRWEKGFGGWRLTDIEPIKSLPIRYEYAYGGNYRTEDKHELCDENYVGVGFANPKTTEPVPCPQILPANYGTPEFGKPIPVEGLGVIAPAWKPRRDRAGTFNLIWEKTRWPDLPEDFSFEFYNTASPGLTLPGFADGTETVHLKNLTPNGTLSFQLPRFELATLLRFEDGRLVPAPINLDTIHIDGEANRVFLTWRGVHPLSPPLRVVEVRMRAPDDVIDRSLPTLTTPV
ncbi:MAG: DUF2169 domain-containing protein [Pirellulaceae bacterium]|nr:DUF2169 domain-containing protein [Pirellulaceae bacterium]